MGVLEIIKTRIEIREFEKKISTKVIKKINEIELIVISMKNKRPQRIRIIKH